jgi:hypothetical protein
MRRLVRPPTILCVACLSIAIGQGCHAVSPAGRGTADAGDDAGRDADGGVDGAGGACAADGESCANGACCDGLECLSLNDGALLCHAPCSAGTDCSSGCCVDVRVSGAAARQLCGEATICFPDGCEPEGESCGSDAPCCAGLACVIGAGAGRDGCRVRCQQNEDCDSGCCTPFSGGEGGFCDDAIYCTCIDAGDACSGDGRSCCDGSRCARFGEDPFACLTTCESDEDCEGNCCSPVRGGASVCAPFPC